MNQQIETSKRSCRTGTNIGVRALKPAATRAAALILAVFTAGLATAAGQTPSKTGSPAETAGG
jgi:hypothetical protein